MVNFKFNKRLDLKKLLKKDNPILDSENIPLNVKVKSSTEPKSSNYWIKFTGNLILIAVGGFLALFIFSRVEKSDDESIEVVYLENFQRDIQEDIKNLKKSIDINSSRILDVKEILADLYKKPDSVDLSNFSNKYISALYVSKFAPSFPTFNDFQTSKRQDIFSSIQLRNDIFRYYDNVEKSMKVIENYETFHKETFVPKFNSEYIKGRDMIIFKKYYEDIDEDDAPNLKLWTVSKDSELFIEAENLLLQRLLFLDRSLEIETDLLDKAKALDGQIANAVGLVK